MAREWRPCPCGRPGRRAMKAQERRHLKQNEFALTTGRLIEKSVENRGRLTMVAGVVVLAVLIAAAVVYWRARQANQAGAMLGTAMAVAQSQIAPASTLPGVQQAAGTFPTEKARAEAAIKAYGEVIAAYPGTD